MQTGKSQSGLLTKISRRVYFGYAIIFVFVGIITKLFLVDVDFGERFKDFNHQILMSELFFICALILALVGFLFYFIKQHANSTLRDSTVLLSAALIAPLVILLLLTPVLMILSPGEVGAEHSRYLGLIIGVGFFIWIVMVPLTIIFQALRIVIVALKK